MAYRPTEDEAAEAENYLEKAIMDFNERMRAPHERGTPNPNPTWPPQPSTLRYNPIRGGGVMWSMSSGSQVVAYYVTTPNGTNNFGMVTAHGQDRHNWDTLLRAKSIRTTVSPSIEWYDWRQRYSMEQKEHRRGT